MRSNSNDKEGLTPTEKLKISLEIKGDNKYNAKSPVFHHIKDVLNKYFLTSKEGKEIMLDMQGAYSPELNKSVISPIIDYLEKIDFFPSKKHNLSNVSQEEKKLTINQIALKYCYEELQITRQNGNQIAKKYGYTSGEKLFQRFTYYSSATNRKGRPLPCTPTKLKNKINLLNSVIEILPSDKRERAIDEVNILTNLLKNDYN